MLCLNFYSHISIQIYRPASEASLFGLQKKKILFVTLLVLGNFQFKKQQQSLHCGEPSNEWRVIVIHYKNKLHLKNSDDNNGNKHCFILSSDFLRNKFDIIIADKLMALSCAPCICWLSTLKRCLFMLLFAAQWQ